MTNQAPRAGLRRWSFQQGTDAYWPQFGGLKDKLEGYNKQVAAQLARADVTVVNLGLIDTPEKALAADTASRGGRRSDFSACLDLRLSSTVLPVVRRAKVPVIILNLSPGEAIDYATFNASRDRGR